MLRIDGLTKLRWERKRNGSIEVFAALGKAGLNLAYPQLDRDSKRVPSGRRIEYVSAEELFHPDSLATALGLPVVLYHPKSGMFENNKEGLLVGSTLQNFIRDDDDTLLMPLALHDERATKLVEDAIALGGHLEVSPGYWIDKSVLMPDGRYQQIGRRYDHVAAPLPAGHGRGGAAIRLRFDSKENCISEDFEVERDAAHVGFNEAPLRCLESEIQGKSFFKTFQASDQVTIQYGKEQRQKKTLIDLGKSRRDKRMKTLIIDSVGYEIDDDDLFTAAVALKNRSDSAVSELTTVKAERSNLQTRVDALTQEVADLKGEVSGYKIKADSLEVSDDALSEALPKAIAADRKDSIETWMLVLPTLRQDNANYEPDYALSSTETKALYLVAKHPELKTDVADSDLKTDAGRRFVDSLWKVLKPQEQTGGDTYGGHSQRADAFSRTDRQLSFLNGAATIQTDAKTNRDNARNNYQKKIENNWKKEDKVS